MLSPTDVPILSTTIFHIRKQLAVAYKTQNSWKWEVLFLLLVSVENNTIAGRNAQFIATLVGPAHLLQLVISQAGEHSGTAHPTPACPRADPSDALAPARRLLAVPRLQQGPSRMGQGPMVLSCMPLWWACRSTRLRVGELSATQGDGGHWAALSMLGGCSAKASLWSRETKGGRLKKESFSIRKYLPARPQGKDNSCTILPARVLHKHSESCTKILHVLGKYSKALPPPRKAVRGPSLTCHDKNKPVMSSPQTTFFFLFERCDLPLVNPISFHHPLFYENRQQGTHWGLAGMLQEIIPKYSCQPAPQHLEVLVLSSGVFKLHSQAKKTLRSAGDA